MASSTEFTILKSLISNETYARKILPYVKDIYFEETPERIVFNLSKDHFIKYDSLATPDVLAIGIENLSNVSSDNFKSIQSLYDSLRESSDSTSDGDISTTEWLIDTTEKWCKERAVYLAILDAIEIHNGTDAIRSREEIPSILSEALAVSFDSDIGHDYFGDFLSRYEFYHELEERVPFGIDYLDKITKGGAPKKSLSIILAGTNVGKSLIMCSLAGNMLKNGKNVLYITLEMSEEKIAERIDANLLNISIDDIIAVPKSSFETKIKNLESKTQGKLIIREYPTSEASVAHFDSLLKELSIVKSFVPDVIFIDYINICASRRYKAGANVNSYTMVKSIAEEIRGLAVKNDLPIISATQTNRTGFNSSDPDLTNTSESFGLPATADLMLAVTTDPALEQLGQLMIKQLKNRFASKITNSKFVVGVDYSKMRIYDVEQSAQEDIVSEVEYLQETKLGSTKFSNFVYD